MNTVNQIFDWSRFTSALYKEVVENKRQLLLIVVSIFLFYLILMIIGNAISNVITDGATREFEKHMIELMPIIVIMSSFPYIAMIVASLSFRNLTSKTGRVALFTSPASTTEKFIVNLVIYVICTFVVFIISVHLADLARVVILKPFQSESFYVPGPFRYLSILTGDSSSIDITSISETLASRGYTAENFKWMILLSIILSPAIYFMGSVLWPRWSVLKTFAAQQVLNFVVSIFIMLIFATPFLYGISRDNISDIDISNLSTAMSASTYVSYALYAVFWYGAWYLFKHKDVVSLKWWS